MAYESEIAPLAAAWIRRKQLEARMIAAETVKLLGAAMGGGPGASARSDGAIEISPEAMLAMFGQGQGG